MDMARIAWPVSSPISSQAALPGFLSPPRSARPPQPRQPLCEMGKKKGGKNRRTQQQQREEQAAGADVGEGNTWAVMQGNALVHNRYFDG
jgi:hypothetical protein